MTAEGAGPRHRRAAVALGLARLLAAAGRTEDPRWRALAWDAFERLPDWCALEVPACAERTRIAGAVALLPAVRRCLRGGTLLRLGELIGTARLEALLRRPYPMVPSDVELAGAAGLERQLLAHGVRVLCAEVDDPGVRTALADVLGAIAGASGGTADDPFDIGAEPEGKRTAPTIDPRAGAVAAGLHLVPAETPSAENDTPSTPPARTAVRVAAVRSR